MKREDLTKEEQIIADYGYVSGHEAGYREGVHDSADVVRKKKNAIYLDGILDGSILTSATIIGIVSLCEWANENEVVDKTKAWCKDKFEKVKVKIKRKK